MVFCHLFQHAPQTHLRIMKRLSISQLKITWRKPSGRAVSCLLSCLIISSIPPAIAEEAKPTAIFDGKTLKGWDFKEGMWRVEDGAVTV